MRLDVASRGKHSMNTSLDVLQLQSHSDCTRCDLHSQTGITNVGVPGEWLSSSLTPSPHVPAVVFLGMNPGQQEDQANRPFIGPSGRLLRKVYIEANDLHRIASVYLLNAVRCWTPTEAQPKKRHYRDCWSHTVSDLDEIAAIGHSKIHLMCLGSSSTEIAYRMLADMKHMSLKRAFAVQSYQSTCGRLFLYSTFHPAAIVRDKEANRIYPVTEHMQVLVQCLLGALPQPSKPHLIKPRNPSSCQPPTALLPLTT